MKKVASFNDKLRIYELLQEHIEKLDDGNCRYRDPAMTDTILAKHVGDNITSKHVERIRLDHFGRIKPVGGNSEAVDRLNEKIDKLTAALCATQERMQSLAKKHDTLCQSLSVNKVIDVRHLILDRAMPNQVVAPNGKGDNVPA